MALPRATAAGAAALLLGGCAALGTRITTDEPEALVWVDGRFAGKGEGRIRQVGPPHTGYVLVVAPDGRRARAVIQRRMTARTVDAALRSLGACLAFCWEYPDRLDVPLPPARPRSGWAVAEGEDPWRTAPGGAPSAWDDPPRWGAGWPPAAAPQPPPR